MREKLTKRAAKRSLSAIGSEPLIKLRDLAVMYCVNDMKAEFIAISILTPITHTLFLSPADATRGNSSRLSDDALIEVS